jgi:poly(A) polymerase
LSGSSESSEEPRAAAREVADVLLEHGHETYFAGGCVRDHLLGLAPADIDVATEAVPDRVLELFPGARGVGASFGVMLVPRRGRMLEVATFRSDFAYEDGRRPGRVSFGSAEADALRRDFTINGIFEHPVTGAIVDFVGGRDDIEQKVLRAIGEPEDRFDEDRLRMLRGIRFAARFDLTIDPATEAAITARADRLAGVSRERVGQEMRRMLADPGRVKAARLAESTGLDRTILGSSRQGPATFDRLSGLSSNVVWIDALVAWELDRSSAADMADRLSTHLVLSNEERLEVAELLATRRQLRHEWKDLAIAGRKRLASTSLFERTLKFVGIEWPDLATEIGDSVMELRKTGLNPPRLLSGDDLIGAGISPGPAFGRVLFSVYDAQLEGRIQTKEEALVLARKALNLDSRGLNAG